MGRILSAKSLVSAAVVIALAATVGGPVVAQRTAQTAHAASGVLVYPDIITELWPKTLDPALTTDSQSIQIIDLIYSGLVKLNGKNQVVPDLAASMPKVSSDRLTYTFTLRSNAEFSDGTPVTAQDVVYSITRTLSKQEASPLALLYLGHIKGAAAWNSGKAKSLTGIKALDSKTVQITLDQPISYFLETLTYPTSYVVKDGTPAGAKLTTTQSLNIGTGPFMFSRPWRYRQEMYFAPNPHWYNASKMKLKEIDVPFISDFNVAYREYQSGQIPMAQVPSAYLASVRNKPDFHSTPLLAIDYITPNQGKDSACKPISCAPFNDIHFRKALLYAINRQVITQKILHGTEVPLCGLVPKGIQGYDPSLCSMTPYDPAKAKAELALAKKDFGGKLPNDGDMTVYYQSGNQDTTNEYTELQNEWNAVGININITATPFNHWLDLVSSNYTPFVENLWIDDYPDAQDFCENLLSNTSPYNVGNYNNTTYQKLITQADVTPNGPDRNNLYYQAQKIAINDVAFIMIGQQTENFQYSQNLHGLTMTSSWIIPQPVDGDWTNVSVS